MDAVCAVGMSPATEGMEEKLRRDNYVGQAPIFYLPGGWAPRQVNFVKRHLVSLVTSSIRRSLQKKGSKRTPEEQAYLELITAGGSQVSYENLDPVRQWLNEHKD